MVQVSRRIILLLEREETQVHREYKRGPPKELALPISMADNPKPLQVHYGKKSFIPNKAFIMLSKQPFPTELQNDHLLTHHFQCNKIKRTTTPLQ